MVEAYARTGDARLEFRHFSLAPNDTTLAAIAFVPGLALGSFLNVVAARVVQGCGFACVLVSGSAYVAEIAPPPRLAQALGFAGILMELGLPPDRLVKAVFGFNLGVELGQLAVVVLAWPMLRALTRARASAHGRVAEAGSAAIAGLGVFWLVSRNF